MSGACIAYCGGTPPPGGSGPGTGPAPPPGAPAGCDSTIWTGWGQCTGSPATKSRVNQCGTWQTVYCYGNISARAVQVQSSSATCADTRASTTGINGTAFQFAAGSASQPAAQTQSGAGYVTFINVLGGNYTISPSLSDPSYILANTCWSQQINTPATGQGLSGSLSVPNDPDTLTWDLGYTYGTPWVQTQDGGVVASTTVTSPLPVGVSPRVFNTNGAGGYPGVVTYGTSYDFDPSTGSSGSTLVSSQNWLVQDSSAATDYYSLFYTRLGAPTTQTYDPIAQGGAKPSSGTYYVTGNMATSGNWTVGATDKIIFLVAGNLAINGKITITPGGFIAFIVKGNITVASSVGVPYTSSTPVVEGVYVTSPTGTFSTGTSAAGTERFVGRGMFAAGTFQLQRDLGVVNANALASAELFTYNPQLLVTMPDSMKDVPVTWQEVAP
ncbi:hypothetical protein M1555_04405 [Patescibacteria group bacterium]|nr:hypothetical protein [Patescibacteria group bacterium]